MSRADDDIGEVDEGEDSKGSRRANPVDIHVGSRVRVRRMLLGMSQEKLGEKLGLTFQQVQKYEKGVNRIGASRLYDLSQVLDVPVQYFFDELPTASQRMAAPGFGERGGDNYIIEFLNTREGLELNKAFARIADGRTRRAILDLVRTLTGEDTLSL